MKWLLSLVLVLVAVGTLRVVGCGDADADLCGGCDDGDPCTEDRCVYDPEDLRFDFSFSWCGPDDPGDPDDYRCVHFRKPDGSPCGGGKVCVDGLCAENLCANCEDDGNSCTIDCDYETGACDYLAVRNWIGCEDDGREGECYEGVCVVR
jgi:hypothetical protein